MDKQGGSRPVVWVKDILLALVVTVVVVGSLFLPGPEKEPPLPGEVIFNLLLTLPIAFRSKFPFAVMSVILGAATAPSLMGFGENGLSWLPLSIAVYTVASIGSGKRRIIALAIQPVGALLRDVLFSDPPDISFFILESALLTVAWFAGDQLRARRRYLAHLEEKAEILASQTEEDTRRIVVEERARIARELHDVITQSVSAIAVQAGAARMAFDRDQDQTLESLSRIETGSRQALVEMRRLLGLLRSEDDRSLSLAPQPTLSRLDALIEQLDAKGLKVTLEIEGMISELSPGLDLSVYRVIEEALGNALGKSSNAHVRVIYGRRDIELEVSYADVPTKDRSFAALRERVALFGGDFEAKAVRDGDFVVRARIPLAA
jgi:signal transduction histidine kinase